MNTTRISYMAPNESLETFQMPSSTFPSSSSSACQFTVFEFVGYFYVMTVLCFIGFVLNIVNIAVFSQKCFNATVYTYMSIISLTDAITLLVMMPRGLGRCAGHLETCNHPIFKRFRIHISYFNTYIGFGVTNTAESASAWLKVLVSIERYVAMKFPVQAQTYCRHSTAKIHVLMIIFLAVVFNTPLFFILRIAPRNVTSETGESRTVLGSELTAFGESTDYDVYTWFRFFLVQIVPLIALCIFNSLLLQVVYESYHKLWHNEAANCNAAQELLESTARRTSLGSTKNRRRSAKQMQLDRRQRAQTKLNIMQICVIFLFLIGQIPQAFSFEKIFNAIVPPWCDKCCKLKIYLRMCGLILGQLSYSLPFFIYLSLNRYFRKTLLTCCSNKPIDQYSRASRVS